jgi:hypothetical protein
MLREEEALIANILQYTYARVYVHCQSVRCSKEKVKMFVGISHLKMMKKQKKNKTMNILSRRASKDTFCSSSSLHTYSSSKCSTT